MSKSKSSSEIKHWLVTVQGSNSYYNPSIPYEVENESNTIEWPGNTTDKRSADIVIFV